MDINRIFLPAVMMDKSAINEIISCNELTSCYGLTLSQTAALKLVETRAEALNSNGRIEFSGGIINKIIRNYSAC